MERKELNEESGLKAKKNWNLKTDESYEALRERFQKNQKIIACWSILWACFAGLTIPVLLWKVNRNALPLIVKPFWNIYGITIFFSIPLFILMLTRTARESRNYKGIGTAINCFEHAQYLFKVWKRNRNPHSLKKCYNNLIVAEEYLRDVPMFKKIYEDVEAKYKDFFEGESN